MPRMWLNWRRLVFNIRLRGKLSRVVRALSAFAKEWRLYQSYMQRGRKAVKQMIAKSRRERWSLPKDGTTNCKQSARDGCGALITCGDSKPMLAPASEKPKPTEYGPVELQPEKLRDGLNEFVEYTLLLKRDLGAYLRRSTAGAAGSRSSACLALVINRRPNQAFAPRAAPVQAGRDSLLLACKSTRLWPAAALT